MPRKKSNLRNNLQKYIIWIGDTAFKEHNLEKYEELLNSLNQLAETTEEYYWKNKDGKSPVPNREELQRIRSAYQKAMNQCNRMMMIPAHEIKGIHTVVNELNNLLSRDEAALDSVSQNQGMTLAEILEAGRSLTVDIGEQNISTVRNQMSDRIPLKIEGKDNITRRGFFTRTTVADPSFNRDILTNNFRKKYPEMSELFDCIDKCDMNTLMMQVYNDVFNQLSVMGEEAENNPDELKNLAYAGWKRNLNKMNVPDDVFEKNISNPEFPKMMTELYHEIHKMQRQYMMYNQDENCIQADVGANIDKRNAAMSSVSALIGKPKLLAKSEPMILMQNGKAISGTFMESAEGKDAYHLSEDDPMHEYGEDVYDNPEVFADISALQALDYICGNIDRHEGNMFYQFGEVDGKTKLIGIKGIDNDMSFGMTPAVTKKNVGNQWIQPEQFGVLDANTADKILSINKSILQAVLSGYGLSEKEINAAWNRTEYLQAKIMEGMEHFQNTLPGVVEAGYLRIVPSDEWHYYKRSTLESVGNNQFAVFGNMKNLVEENEKKAKSMGEYIEAGNACMHKLFQVDVYTEEKEQELIPAAKPLGYGTELKEPAKNPVETMKFVVPTETTLDVATGAINRRFAFSYQDREGNIQKCFFTKTNTLDLYESIDKSFELLLEDNPQYEELFERLKSYYHKQYKATDIEEPAAVPELEELGYEKEEIEAFQEDKDFNRMLGMINVQIYAIYSCYEEVIETEYRSSSGRIDLRNVAMNQIGDALGVPDLLARAVPAQVQIGESIIDGISMEKVEGIDIRNIKEGDPVLNIQESIFDGEGLKSVADLQIVDYICMNTDRHCENMIYQFEDLGTDHPKFAGVRGIDNDYSFVGICTAPDKTMGNYNVALNKIKVISKEMADRILHMGSDDITNVLDGLTLNKKEIIAVQQRLTRLQNALRDGNIRIVNQEEWKDMKFETLNEAGTLFHQIKKGYEEIKKSSKNHPKEISFKDIRRVEEFSEEALKNKSIDDYMKTVGNGFKDKIYGIIQSADSFHELDERDLFICSKENIKLLRQMIDQADPALMRSSKEFKMMKRSCENAAGSIRRIEREMKKNRHTIPTAEQSQHLYECLLDLKNTASVYEMYKKNSIGERRTKPREKVRIEAAKSAALISERICSGFRENEKERSLELHTGRILNREIKSVINHMKSSEFHKADYKKSFAKIIYLKTIVENVERYKESNKISSVLNQKAVNKAVNVITKTEAFDNFMKISPEKLLGMLERKDGNPFYKQFLRENAAEQMKSKNENLLQTSEEAENELEGQFEIV